MTILGAIALGLFAIVFFRLWFLEVLSGDHYVQQARDNRVRIVPVPAARGEILDRNGRVLVENEAQWQKIEPLLPKIKRRKRGRPPKDNRVVLEGILWVLKTGARWRDARQRTPWPTSST